MATSLEVSIYFLGDSNGLKTSLAGRSVHKFTEPNLLINVMYLEVFIQTSLQILALGVIKLDLSISILIYNSI